MEFKKLNILIVDDDDFDQRQLKRSIAKSDLLANVVIVDTPTEAIIKLQQDQFDCCFIDYLMPLMNGVELVKEIRAFNDLIPLIIVTSQSDPELSKEAINAGATNYMTKSLINPEGVSLLLRNSLHLQKIENDLKEAKKEALKFAQAKQDFLSNMSHEIRTPLNAINGFSDLLSQTTLNSEQTKYVNILNVASKNLSILINDILDVSKIESGALQLESNPIDIEQIIDDVIAIEEKKANDKGISLFADFKNINTKVIGDRTRIMQIVLNLVSNAIKFTNKGHVSINVKEKAQKDNKTIIRISIEDTGIGIKKEHISSLFERFTQAEKETTRLYGGTGLGLNIVKKLVKIMEGEISVQSELNIGSTFTVELPFQRSEKISEIDYMPENTIQKPKDSLKNMCILVVEDNEHNQLLIKTYLQKNGAQVHQAENGKVAINFIEQNNYDCILMDLQMPVMDGFETTKYIRETLKSNVPIIACSAQSTADDKKTCIAKGMNDYISKPYTEQQLLETITSINQSDVAKQNEEKVEQKTFTLFDEFQSIFEEMEKEDGPYFKSAMLEISKKRIHPDISELEIAMADENKVEIGRLAHKLIGSFLSLNFPNGSAVAKATENSVITNNEKAMKENSQALLSYLHNLKTFLANA